MWLPVTLTLSAVAAALSVWLMLRCGQARRKSGVSVGDGGDEFLIRRMRAHANFVETAPIVLILIAVIELAGGNHTALWGVGIAWAIGRVAHAFGMDGNTAARAAGTATTALTLLGMALWALVIAHTPTRGGTLPDISNTPIPVA